MNHGVIITHYPYVIKTTIKSGEEHKKYVQYEKEISKMKSNVAATVCGEKGAVIVRKLESLKQIFLLCIGKKEIMPFTVITLMLYSVKLTTCECLKGALLLERKCRQKNNVANVIK